MESRLVCLLGMVQQWIWGCREGLSYLPLITVRKWTHSGELIYFQSYWQSLKPMMEWKASVSYERSIIPQTNTNSTSEIQPTLLSAHEIFSSQVTRMDSFLVRLKQQLFLCYQEPPRRQNMPDHFVGSCCASFGSMAAIFLSAWSTFPSSCAEGCGSQLGGNGTAALLLSTPVPSLRPAPARL